MVTANLPSVINGNFQSGLTHPSKTDEEMVKLIRSMPGAQPQPSLQWITDTVKTARVNFQKAYKQWQQADTFYNGEFSFDVPSGGTMVKLGTFRSVVKTGVDHVAPGFPDITVPPRSPRALAAAELTEKFLTGSHHMLEQNTPTRREVVKHQFLYGVAWQKTEFEGSRWADIPEPPAEGEDDSDYREALDELISARELNFPIKAAVVNPQDALWDTNDPHDPQWFIRGVRIDARWVKAHFPAWNGTVNSGLIPLFEVWTKKWVAYVADMKWAMQPRAHGYGVVPFTQYWPQTGISTTSMKPDHLYQGVGHANWSMLLAQSQLVSQHIDITRKSAWPTKDFHGPATLVQSTRENYDDAPGSKNHVPNGVEIKRGEIAEAPNSILAGKEMLDDAIEEATVSKVARGQRPTGAASGFMVASLAGIASLNFTSVKEATERGMQKQNEIILRIVENVIRDPVTVWGKTESGSLDATIRPRDIRGHYISIVSLSTVSPEESDRLVNLWSNKHREGFVDHLTALRNAKVANPLEVMARIQAESFFNNELVQQAFAQIAASSIPLLQEALNAVTNSEDPDGQIAGQISNAINTQGAGQLPNAGNFSQGNQAGIRPQNPGTGVPTTVQPVLPGSTAEQNLVGRQLAGPRSGNVRVPGANLAPGGGLTR